MGLVFLGYDDCVQLSAVQLSTLPNSGLYKSRIFLVGTQVLYNAKVSSLNSILQYFHCIPYILTDTSKSGIECDNWVHCSCEQSFPSSFWIPGEKEKNLPLSRAKSTINLDRAMLRKAF